MLATTACRLIGQVTRRNVSNRLAPRSRAASSVDGRDPVQPGEQRQDHVRDVAVDQPEDDRAGMAAQPVTWTSKSPPRLSVLLTRPSFCSRLTQASIRIM